MSTPSAPDQPRSRTLILGLGNDLLSDDAIGLRLAAGLRKHLAGWPDLTVEETTESGLGLLDLVIGHENLVLLDAVQTGKAEPGFVHQMDGWQMKLLPPVSPHFLGVGEMLALGKELGLAVPRRVKVFAVEVQDPFVLSRQMTATLEAAFPAILEEIERSLESTAGLLSVAARAGAASPEVTGASGYQARP